MQTAEIIYTDKKEVSCKGNGGALGHPKIYMNIEATGEVQCPYCSKKFIFNKEKAKK